jgi:hypothetical protein
MSKIYRRRLRRQQAGVQAPQGGPDFVSPEEQFRMSLDIGNLERASRVWQDSQAWLEQLQERPLAVPLCPAFAPRSWWQEQGQCPLGHISLDGHAAGEPCLLDQLASPEQEVAGPADDLALEQLVDQLPAAQATAMRLTIL